MADLLMAVPSVAHIAVSPKTIIEHIPEGVSYMTELISVVVSLLVGGGLGWYAKGRGMAGMKNDLSNAEKTIVDLKSKLSPAS